MKQEKENRAIVLTSIDLKSLFVDFASIFNAMSFPGLSMKFNLFFNSKEIVVKTDAKLYRRDFCSPNNLRNVAIVIFLSANNLVN